MNATLSILAERRRQADEELRIAREKADVEWRARFVPHAILLGERKIPTSITMYAITGGSDRWLHIGLDLSMPSDTFVQQVLAELPSRLKQEKYKPLEVPFFGTALGFVVNYSPDQAVRYDLNGNVVESLSKAIRPGHASFSLKGGTPITDLGHDLEVVEISAS